MDYTDLKTTLSEGIPEKIEVASQEELIELHKHFDNLYEEELDKQQVKSGCHVTYQGKKIEIVLKSNQK